MIDFLRGLLFPLQELRQQGEKKKRSRDEANDDDDGDDAEGALGVRKKVTGGKKKKWKVQK